MTSDATRHSRRSWLSHPWLPAVLLLVSLPASSHAAGKRPFGIEDYYRVRNPSHIDLSPEGHSLVYQLKTTDLPRAKSNVDLYRVGAAGGEPVRLTWTQDVSETSPTHSPDGKWIAFIAKRHGQEQRQIWLLPATGGEARALTDLSTSVDGLVWSPDGKYIAFASKVHPECGADGDCNEARDASREAGPLTAHVTDELLYRHWTEWADGKVSHVLMVEVDTRKVRDMTPGDRDAPVFALGGPAGYAFSPDSKELCYTGNPDPRETLAWSTNSDLWVVPVEAGPDGAPPAARNLTEDNPAWDGGPRYSPDGRYIAYLRQSRAGFESDLVRLALHDRHEGGTRIVVEEFENWVGQFEWLSDGSGWVFTAPFEGRVPLFRASLTDKRATAVADFAAIDEFVLSPEDRTAFVVQRSIGRPRELWRLELTESVDPVRLTRHNLELEREVDIRPAESMWIEGADGRRVQVFVIKPHGFDPAKKYPLILNVHGGPQYMWSDAFRGDWQVYPGAGYVVAFPNPHGSTGYGQTFTDRISGDWGGRVFEDLMRVTDALAALPYVDADRMGAMGWSYGGYMMNWFQGHTDRFKALANMMGLFDLRSFYLATEELWFPEWDLGGRPWDSELYEKWNPAGSIEKFATPMLIVTGELDFRVPYTQGLMAHTALRRQGIPSRLIVLPESGHWPGWYEMALYYTAHLDWFQRYLGGGRPPWSVEDFVTHSVFDIDTGERLVPGTD